MALAGKNAQIYLTDAQAQSTSMTDELCDAVDSSDPPLTWQISDSTKNIFDPEHTFTVEVNPDVGGGGSWSTVSPSDYTLRYLLGVVVFTSNPFGGTHPDEAVRVDGQYLSKYSLIEGFSAAPEVTRNQHEIAQFGDAAQRRQQGLLDVSVEWEQYEVLDPPLDDSASTPPDTLSEMIAGTSDALRVFSFQPDDSESELYRAWMQPESLSIDSPSDDAQSQSMSWTVTEQSTTMSSQTAEGFDSIRYS